MADAVLSGQATCRPVRGIGRRCLERLDQHRLDHVVTDRASRTRTGSVNQPVETVGCETVSPLADRHRVAAQFR